MINRKLQDALVLCKTGRLAEARQIYIKLRKTVPNHPELLANLGAIELQLGNIDDGFNLLQKSLSVHPNQPQVLINLGNVFMDKGCYSEALKNYERSILLAHSYGAHYNKGRVLYSLKKFEDAITSYDQAIRLNPHSLDAYNNRGVSLNELGKYDEAIASYDQAIRLNPHSFDAYYNHGVSLNELGKYDEAIASYDQAIRLNPVDCQVLNKKALSYYRLGAFNNALDCYLNAIKLNPDFAEAHYNLAQLYLNQFDFLNGWKEYDWRFLVKENGIIPPKIAAPEWDGRKKLNSLHLWGEQGIGDQILYSSMLSDLNEFSPGVSVSVNKKLLPIMSRSFPNINFVDQNELLQKFDGQLALGSLGKFLRPALDSFKQQRNSFLLADKEKSQSIKANLALVEKPLCGLSWRSINPRVGDQKSLAIQQLFEVLRSDNLDFLNLQYGDIRSDLVTISKYPKLNLVEDINLFEDIDGLLSMIDICDLVVTVSNTTAHLAGALGKDTLLIVPSSVGKFWYWNDINGRSLWYPTVRIFRQKDQGDWSDPLAQVKKYIEEKYVK